MNPAWRWICSSMPPNLQVPDRICRDLFQIYRESLHNVKKHAHATHVVVKLWQNESKLSLWLTITGRL